MRRTYESHVTVEGMNPQRFQRICKEIGVKPVMIEQDTGSGVDQMMTAKFHPGVDLNCAMSAMNEITRHFLPYVCRRKLEVIVGKRTHVKNYLYLEFHSKFLLRRGSLHDFVRIVRDLGGHTSRNSLKHEAGSDKIYHFVTTRDLSLMEKIVKRLSAGPERYAYMGIIRECVVFDDNPTIDRHWAHDCGACRIKEFDLTV